MTSSHDGYPRYFIRPEVAGCPWSEVSRDTYLEAENRWTQSRDAADGSWFFGNGVQGRVQYKPFASEQDVISGVY